MVGHKRLSRLFSGNLPAMFPLLVFSAFTVFWIVYRFTCLLLFVWEFFPDLLLVKFACLLLLKLSLFACDLFSS